MTDLVERLNDLAGQRHRDRGLDDALREAASRISQQDAELERMRKENQSLTEAAIVGEYMWTPAELHEARKEAFFQGWEMSNTGGMEDTCADAWAFWSLMEDGRDEVEPDRYARRAKAEETKP